MILPTIRVAVQKQAVLKADTDNHYRHMLADALKRSGIPVSGDSLNFEPTRGEIRTHVNQRGMCVFEWFDVEDEL